MCVVYSIMITYTSIDGIYKINFQFRIYFVHVILQSRSKIGAAILASTRIYPKLFEHVCQKFLLSGPFSLFTKMTRGIGSNKTCQFFLHSAGCSFQMKWNQILHCIKILLAHLISEASIQTFLGSVFQPRPCLVCIRVKKSPRGQITCITKFSLSSILLLGHCKKSLLVSLFLSFFFLMALVSYVQ